MQAETVVFQTATKPARNPLPVSGGTNPARTKIFIMTITLSVWTNIKDEQKATGIFKDLLNGSTFTQTKSEIYWKDETKRVLTFKTQADPGQDVKTKLFNDLNLISTNWTLNVEGLNKACKLPYNSAI